MKNIIFKTVTILGATVLACLLAEAALRSFGTQLGTIYINRKIYEVSGNSILQYQLKPDSSAKTDVVYTINSFGMRNKPIAQLKSSGTKRIAVMGDSIAFGYWVGDSDSFPAQLETMLATTGSTSPQTEVMNFGVSGYNFDQEIELLRTKALLFEPDLVIVAFCLNDLEDIFSYDYGLTVNRMERRQKGSIWRRLYEAGLDHSILLSAIQYRLIEHELRQQYVSTQYEESPPMPSKREQETIRRTLAEKMGTLRATAVNRSSRQVPVLFCMFPTFDYDYRKYPNRWVHSMVAAEAVKSGFTVVDLLPAYSRYANRDIRADIIHPNALGHRIAAAELLRVIKAAGLLH